MAKYPIVVVKENPGTEESGGKLVVAVAWRDEKSGKVNHAEMKFPDVVGTLREQALVNEQPVQAENRHYELELGLEDYPESEEGATGA